MPNRSRPAEASARTSGRGTLRRLQSRVQRREHHRGTKESIGRGGLVQAKPMVQATSRPANGVSLRATGRRVSAVVYRICMFTALQFDLASAGRVTQPMTDPSRRVGFDAHMIGRNETGNETYALGLLAGLHQVGYPVDVYATTSLAPSVHRQHRIFPHPGAVRVPLVAPLLALRDRLNLYHGTYVLPPILLCPSVVTVHDVTFQLHPEWFTHGVRQLLRRLVPRAMRQASHIITISECTKRDLVEHFGVDADKITVTALAPRPAFARATSSRCERGPSLLMVGNIQPRKNVDTVLRALALLRDRGRAVPLVIAGQPGLQAGRVMAKVSQLGLDHLVRFTGYIADRDLAALYAQSTVLVHPALYEGFGLTVLEAMAQGLPVIASSAASIPEVAGDAAILLDPLEPEAWADAIDHLLHDTARREMLRSLGLDRATRFSWATCADQTIQVYRQVLNV